MQSAKQVAEAHRAVAEAEAGAWTQAMDEDRESVLLALQLQDTLREEVKRNGTLGPRTAHAAGGGTPTQLTRRTPL